MLAAFPASSLEEELALVHPCDQVLKVAAEQADLAAAVGWALRADSVAFLVSNREEGLAWVRRCDQVLKADRELDFRAAAVDWEN